MDELNIAHIHFDPEVWHPLDHRIGSARCRTFQATGFESIRKHAFYWWNCKRYDDLGWLYAALFCSWGHHKMQTWYRTRDKSTAEACAWCTHRTPWRKAQCR